MKSEAGLYFGIAKANCHLWLARLACPTGASSMFGASIFLAEVSH